MSEKETNLALYLSLTAISVSLLIEAASLFRINSIFSTETIATIYLFLGFAVAMTSIVFLIRLKNNF